LSPVGGVRLCAIVRTINYSPVFRSLFPRDSPEGSTTPISPINGNTATGTLNPNFPLTNVVYSVVSFAAVTNPANPLYDLLNSANPSGAFMCTEQTQVITYGLALVSNCGQVLTTNRSN
jgi:hypothetical protein